MTCSSVDPCPICYDNYSNNNNLSNHPNNSVLVTKNKIILNKNYTYRNFLRNSLKSKIKLECSHLFHYNCIKIWYNTYDTYNNKNDSCPMCRRPILFKNKIITEIVFRKQKPKINKPQNTINIFGMLYCVGYPTLKYERRRYQCDFISNYKHRS